MRERDRIETVAARKMGLMSSVRLILIKSRDLKDFSVVQWLIADFFIRRLKFNKHILVLYL